ncbi:MAG: hypothetical protein Q8O64_16310 [Sideroxyarcus sp.]|nr:hypothetical protein [Sideroxyarcus sp.]
MQLQEAYRQKKAAQLKEWGAQIDLLEAKLGNTSADMKVKLAEQLQALRDQHRAASEKLKEVGTASGEAWEQIKTTADTIWDDLKSGLADAKARFK